MADQVVFEVRSLNQLREILAETFDSMQWTYTDVARGAGRKPSFARTVALFLQGRTRSPHFITVMDILRALNCRLHLTERPFRKTRKSYRVVQSA